MCTYKTVSVQTTGALRLGNRWLKVDSASVFYDHPISLTTDHCLTLVAHAESGERIVIELSPHSAAELRDAIEQVLPDRNSSIST